MIAFVAGATGLTGRAVVGHLRARGVATHAHVRPDSHRLAEWRERFADLGAQVDTTAWDRAALTARFAALQPTHVFALLGTTKKRARAGDGDYRAVDFGLTALLIEALQAAAVPARFVYLSSAGVTPDTRNAYLRARADIEALLAASDLDWLVARPSFIVGDRDVERPLESIGAGAADLLLGLGRLIGFKRAAETYRSTPAPVLAGALVQHGLNGPGKRVIDGADLRIAGSSAPSEAPSTSEEGSI